MIFDGPNRRIVLEASDGNTVEAQDIYSRWKDWVATGDGPQYPNAFTTIGGDPLGGGLFAGSYFFLNTADGWLVRPREESHNLVITGNLYPLVAGSPMFSPTLGVYQISIRLQSSSLTQALTTGGVDTALILKAIEEWGIINLAG